MQPPPPNPAALRAGRRWQDRAERDLEMARQLLGSTPPYPDGAVYHAQPAAEKSLKAFLTAQGASFRRTHDLVELLGQCRPIDGRFAQFASATQP
jgi:HEPN domain-containing protein